MRFSPNAVGSALPVVPTIDAAVVPGLHISFWHGHWLPNGTPKDMIGKISAAVVDMLADPDVCKRFADLRQEIPREANQRRRSGGRYHKAEVEKWWPLNKAANIKSN